MRFWLLALALALTLIPGLFAPTSGRAQDVTTIGDVFNAAGDVAVDEAGNIYIANFGDFLNNANGTEVWKMTPDGTRTLFASGLQGASGNEFDADGNLFQSNIAAGIISKIDPGGNVTTFSAGHSAPVGIAIDDDGNLYVANCGNNSIRKITPDGLFNTLFSFGTMYNCPNGMTIGDDGFLYVANFSNGWIVKVDLNSGLPTTNASNFVFVPGSNNGHITSVGGDLYVVGRGSHRIYKVTLGGVITPIAGSGIQGDLDGPALQAQFSFPNGIGASPDGRYLYVNSKTDNAVSTLNPVKLKRIELDIPVQTVESTLGRIKAMYR